MTAAAPPRVRAAVAAALVGMVASTLQQTLLATATPTIVAQLGHQGWYAWVSGAYLLASTLVLPVAGVVTDRVGARPMYAVGMGAFAAGTCGVMTSPSMGVLLASRVIQGAGAGMLVPAALAVVGLLPPDRRGRAFGAMGAVQVLANIAGPLLGGWLTTRWGWRWAMGATLPFIAVGWVMAWMAMPSADADGRWWRIRLRDLWPAVPGKDLWQLLGLGFLVGGMTVAAITYLPWALATLHHLDASSIGYRLLPMLLASAVGSAVGGALAERPTVLAWCWSVVSGAVVMTFGAAPGWLTVAGAGIGLGCGAALPALLTRVQAAAGAARIASTSSLLQLARHGGAAVLVPLVGLWPAVIPDPSAAAAGLSSCLVLVAVCGLLISWRIR